MLVTRSSVIFDRDMIALFASQNFRANFQYGGPHMGNNRLDQYILYI